jgi:hypothetical protein
MSAKFCCLQQNTAKKTKLRIFIMAKKKELKQEIKATKAKISKQEGKLKKLKKKLKKA